MQGHLLATEGVLEVPPREDACAHFGLPPDHEGDLIVISDANRILGTRPENHDLTQLDEPLRAHGGLGAACPPLLLNRPGDATAGAMAVRNFDAYDLASNRLA